MDVATLAGVILGFFLIISSILMASSLAIFIHVPSLMITIGGTIAATLINYPLSKVLSVFKVARTAVLFKLPPVDVEIDRMVEFANVARREGLLSLEEKLEDLEDPFLGKGIRLIIDGFPQETVRAILAIELEYMEQRHGTGKSILDSMGSFCPAFGMIGTLIGLVAMLQTLDDPSQIGGGMAVALLTTFYGALFANLIFIPLAGKLDTRNREETMMREVMIEGLLSIQAGDRPNLVAEKLKSFVAPEVRRQMEASKARG
jgi:chemotaxis protein MotA